MSERMKFPGDEFVLRMHIEFVGEDDEPGRGCRGKTFEQSAGPIRSDR